MSTGIATTANQACQVLGKVPSHADYIQRGFFPDAIERWHHAFSGGLEVLARQRPEEWLGAYLISPVWYVAFSNRNLPENTFNLGVVVPSVDSGGRYYPLLVLQRVIAQSMLAALEKNQALLVAVENVVLDALQEKEQAPSIFFDVLVGAVEAALETPNALDHASTDTDESVTGDKVMADLRGELWLDEQVAGSVITSNLEHYPRIENELLNMTLPKDAALLGRALQLANTTDYGLWISKPVPDQTQKIALIRAVPSTQQMARLLSAYNIVAVDEA